MKQLILRIVIALAECALSVLTASAGGACNSCVQTQVASTALVVTQFAVPVAVPQYAVTVAPTSHVQYGGVSTGANQTSYGTVGATKTSDTTLEDRIAAKVVKALEASGKLSGVPKPPQTAVAQACAKCHGGVNPKGGLSLEDVSSLSDEQRLKSIARVLADDATQRMPPAASDIKLSAEDIGKVLQELSQISKGK
ncbi:MAG TPA: c-type cytochrome domain-containing protein [Pirellulales bacterium]|jgi:mono/diheme cytochrome c family protein|nr:c-type cytochrome domain-containing protein [Pirellulales bacterium]